MDVPCPGCLERDVRIVALEARVAQLLAVVEQQARRIEVLEAEVARLRGDKQKPRSNSKPSALSKPAAAQSAYVHRFDRDAAHHDF